MARLQLPVHSYTLRSQPASTARLVNCYPEALPADAKTPLVLSRAPGVVSDVTPGSPIRGLHYAFGQLFAVAGSKLYYLPQGGSASQRGTIPGTGRVSMAHNDTYLVVVAEPNAYYTNGTDTVTQISDPDFVSRGAKYVKFMDNYMLFMEPNSGRFFCADVGTVTDFNALNFATAEAAPDDLVGMEVDHRQVILFGSETLEIWDNVGGSGFPFSRALNGVAEIGCFNGDTIAKVDNSVFWLANDYTIRRLNGITPVKVSTYAVEDFLSGVDVSTGSAYCYSQNGHSFYVLNFSTGCWVYDVTSDKWHERASYPNDYYRWQTHAVAYGQQYVGDAYSDVVGYFDPDVYVESGSTQIMSWTYQPVYADNRRAFHSRLEVVLETGVGLTSGQGSDPEIMLECSDDGGRTWRSFPNRRIGRIGEYSWRVVWHALGSARQRVYRMSVSDPVKVVVSETTLEVVGGRV